MKASALLLIVLCLAGCGVHRQITKEQAIQVARDYVKKQLPALDISQKLPSADLFMNAPGGAV
jgi:hypothetical protein